MAQIPIPVRKRSVKRSPASGAPRANRPVRSGNARPKASPMRHNPRGPRPGQVPSFLDRLLMRGSALGRSISEGVRDQLSGLLSSGGETGTAQPAASGGAVRTAEMMLERAKEAVEVTRREMVDEAKSARGPRYERLAERLRQEQAAEQQAFQSLSQAQSALAARKTFETTLGAGASVAGGTIGLKLGKFVSAGIDKRNQAAIAAQAAGITSAAKEATTQLNAAQKSGRLTPARRVRLEALGRTRLPNPSSGIGIGGAMIGLGAYSLLRASKLEGEDTFAGKLALTAAGVFEAGLGVGAIVQGRHNRANALAAVDPRDVATLRAAGMLARDRAIRQTQGPGVTARSAKPAGGFRNLFRRARGTAPLMAGVAVGAAALTFADAARAGESTGRAARAAGVAAADVLSLGGIQTYRERRAAGDSRVVAGLRGVGAAVDNALLFGSVQGVHQAVREGIYYRSPEGRKVAAALRAAQRIELRRQATTLDQGFGPTAGTRSEAAARQQRFVVGQLGGVPLSRAAARARAVAAAGAAGRQGQAGAPKAAGAFYMRRDPRSGKMVRVKNGNRNR